MSTRTTNQMVREFNTILTAIGRFNGPHNQLSEFRNCFEAGMDFETALGCAGLSDQPEATIEVLRRYWDNLEAKAA